MTGPLLIHNTYGPPDEMSPEVYFRDENSLMDLEDYALSLCKGSVLDVGAGTGALSLILQQRGLQVDALEQSAVACSIMKSRGVSQIFCQDYFDFTGAKRYETLLFLMNGIGLCKKLDYLKFIFRHAKNLLAPGGQLIFDSSDVRYVFDSIPTDHYYGEMKYRYEYNDALGPWFHWLYVDPTTLLDVVPETGFKVQIIAEDSSGHFLARATKI